MMAVVVFLGCNSYKWVVSYCRDLYSVVTIVLVRVH